MKPFVAALGEELDLTSEEIAEILWLRVQMGELSPPEVIETPGVDPNDRSSVPPTPRDSSDREPIRSNPTETAPPPAEIHLEDRTANLGSGLKIALPDARSLREPLSLARSLKPLLQRVASGWSNVLDEAATIDRIINEKLWLPTFKPNLEPWLDLVLVVDESVSMQIWQRTIAELKRFLAAYGVFRDVRVYSLVVEGERVYVRPRLGTAGQTQTLRNPQELIDPIGRRLILVATDCVSGFWRTGELLPALQTWAKNSPMAIVQMLPEWLWNRSGLGLATTVRFTAQAAGTPNDRLMATSISFCDDLDLELGVKVPVVTLEPESIEAWAQLVAGKGGVRSPGVVFNPEPMATDGAFGSRTGGVSGEERVRRFQATASPMARQLAMILAAAPAINLPIVRILQDRLLPRSQQVHVAEVFLGGLLKPLVEVDAQSNPDTVPYAFMDGVRDVLLDSVPTTEVVNVMQEVSQFVAERLGLTLDAFIGVLRNPQESGDLEVVSQSRPFALVTAQILRKLGGGYAQFAQELEQANRQILVSGNKKMVKPSNLNDIIQGILVGTDTDDYRETLRQLLDNGDRETILKLGKYNINIGDGTDIHIGDRIYQQWDDLAIQEIIKAIQKLNWRCVANFTEIDYTQGEVQSTGIGIVDNLAKQLTNFSHQHVMRYGLKLAFSPNRDREYFISGGHQVIKRWQTTTWKILQEITDTGISDLWFTSVTISPDAQLIAVCKAYQIKIWRLGSANPLHTFGKTLFSNPLDISGFDSIAFSPDGKLLAANDDRDIKIWDVESGQELVKLSGHTEKVTCVAFNPIDRQILASCSYDKDIKIWNIEKNRCLGTLSGHQAAVYTLAFSPDGEILASGSNDNSIQLWYLNTAEIIQPLRRHSQAVTCLVFHPDGKTLVSGSNDGTIIEWDMTAKEVRTTFPEQHRRGVTSIAISPNGDTVISGGRDQTIKVWRQQD